MRHHLADAFLQQKMLPFPAKSVRLRKGCMQDFSVFCICRQPDDGNKSGDFDATLVASAVKQFTQELKGKLPGNPPIRIYEYVATKPQFAFIKPLTAVESPTS